MADVPELDGVAAALDELCAVDPSALADGATVRRLHAQLERLACVVVRAAGGFDAGGEWAVDGARSAAAWISTECRQPSVAARRRVRLGRALRHLPAVEAAWLAGRIPESHVLLLAAARTPATADAFGRDEAMLVGEAERLRHHELVRVLAYWRQLADPEGVEVDAGRLHAARRAHLSPGLDGTGFLEAVFDPIGYAIFDRVLRDIEGRLFDVDWASGSGRTPPQRRHDALVEMARRAAAVPAGARMPEPLFTVLVGYETFAGRICELANGTVVTPGSLVPWLDAAHVERVVFDGPARVLNVGVRRRLFTGATRRAVLVRERECFHRHCDVPAERCQVDHRLPWAAGGPTVDTNGRPACGFHNRLRHGAREPP